MHLISSMTFAYSKSNFVIFRGSVVITQNNKRTILKSVLKSFSILRFFLRLANIFQPWAGAKKIFVVRNPKCLINNCP